MKIIRKTVRVYTPAELKAKYPKGFERAHDWFKEGNDGVPWQEEIMDSLKATFKHSGLALRDWYIEGLYPSQSWVKFNMESDVENLRGQRALAWLENNLLEGLRERRSFIHRAKKYSDKWHVFNKYGEIPSCPFTGVCFDEDFIESLVKDVQNGETLYRAYFNLARVAGKLFEAEIENQNSEEYFLDYSDLLFTKEGRIVEL